MSEKKPGVYLCKGCGIAEAIDIGALEKIGKSEFRIGHCVAAEALCAPENVAAMRKDVQEGVVNRLVVGACSPRVMADKFRFDGVPVVRANLREHVAWSQPPHAEDTEMLAADAIRMAAAQLTKTEQPQPAALPDVARSILVVGAGVTGLTAALEAAKSGYDVVLVEKATPSVAGRRGGRCARRTLRPIATYTTTTSTSWSPQSKPTAVFASSPDLSSQARPVNQARSRHPSHALGRFSLKLWARSSWRPDGAL